MRIIGGACKGKQIFAGNNLRLRPTTDFAKEGLFNILDNCFYFEDLKVLDLFSGSGNISYEFASRGCSLVHSVEIDPRHVRFIRSTIRSLELNQVRVVRDDVSHFLSICQQQYDVIFADPPYDMLHINELPVMVLSENILTEDGIFILEHSRHYDFSPDSGYYDHRKYGNVHFSFFKK